MRSVAEARTSIDRLRTLGMQGADGSAVPVLTLDGLEAPDAETCPSPGTSNTSQGSSSGPDGETSEQMRLVVSLALGGTPAAVLVRGVGDPLVATVGPLPRSLGHSSRIKGAAVLDDDSVLLLLDAGVVLDRSFPLKGGSPGA